MNSIAAIDFFINFVIITMEKQLYMNNKKNKQQTQDIVCRTKGCKSRKVSALVVIWAIVAIFVGIESCSNKADEITKKRLALKYDYISPFSFGRAVVRIGEPDNGKYGMINEMDTLLLPMSYDDIRELQGGLSMVFSGDRYSENGKYGIVDSLGNFVLPMEYQSVGKFYEGLARVMKGNMYGFVDTNGRMVVECKYDLAGFYSAGLVNVCSGNKWGYIDNAGNVVVPVNYNYAEAFYEGLARVQLNGKYGFIDNTGKEVIALEYDFVSRFVGGYAIVRKDDGDRCNFGLIDKTGKVVVPIVHGWVDWDGKGPLLVREGEEYCFIDINTNKQIAGGFDSASLFSEGLASVSRDNRLGYIDLSGREVVSCRYVRAYNFVEGLAIVAEGDPNEPDYGCIDSTGTVVIPCKYFDVSFAADGYIEVIDGKSYAEGLYGYFDRNGKEIVPVKYKQAVYFEGLGLFKAVDENGVQYLFGPDGESISTESGI